MRLVDFKYEYQELLRQMRKEVKSMREFADSLEAGHEGKTDLLSMMMSAKAASIRMVADNLDIKIKLFKDN